MASSPTGDRSTMRLDVWHDIACAHCYYGSANLVRALDTLADIVAVEVRWRSFQLDPRPDAARLVGVRPPTLFEYLASFNGSVEAARAAAARVAVRARASGLEFRPDLVKPYNTADAHRLMHIAANEGRGTEMVLRLHREYWADGADLSDTQTLATIAASVGLDAQRTTTMLAADAYRDAVAADREAASAAGIFGVPTAVIDSRFMLQPTMDPGDMRDEILRYLRRG
ncbi:DsbA family oxidoreductase [Dactylosporangium sp. CA-233914]|uniref:DsbA family oxidoreductase n=1 Tax=Dactylosporangium sp. CA-233914 TaxID=3239934 RepID=UPI003D8A8CF5